MKTYENCTYLLPILFIFSDTSIGQSDLPEETIKEIEKEIQQLETAEQRKIYLEKISEDDQAVRDSEISADILLKYGKDSKEFMAYAKAQWNQDEINLIKIEKYLAIHGISK